MVWCGWTRPSAGSGSSPAPSVNSFGIPPAAAGWVNAATSSEYLANATGSATPNTKGSWTQVVASTPSDIDMLVVTFASATAVNGADTSTLLDIGIGGAGSEVALIENFGAGYTANGSRFAFPVRIPSGTRIAIRCQGVQVSKTVSVYMRGHVLPVTPADYVYNYGGNTANSQGINIPAPAANNVESDWVEVAASLPERIGAVTLGIQGMGDLSWSALPSCFDIGYGPIGSEVVAASDIVLYPTTTEVTIHGGHFSGTCIPVDIPSGERLVVRYQTGATGNRHCVTAHCAPWRE